MAEYIDRKALEKAMTIAAANGKDKDRRTWAKAICVLHDMPTADVAPVVHGRWMPFHSEAAGDIQYCSACEIGFDAKMAYCPHCGAKMDIKNGGDNDAVD